MATPSQMWTLEQLKNSLKARPEIKGWIIHQEHSHRRERYFLFDSDKPSSALAIDQDRNVDQQDIQVRLFVRLKNKPERQGEMSKKLFLAKPLEPQLDSAVQSALQTDHQAWELPSTLPQQIPHVATCDQGMAEDMERRLEETTEEIRRAVAVKRPTRFNSSELFLSLHNHELHLSNGLTHRSSQSRIYVEAAYSMSRKRPDGALESDEFLTTRWGVTQQELGISTLFAGASDHAEHSLDVTKPTTGKYPVIVDADVLLTLLNGHVSQLSGVNAYNGLPFVKPGDELIPGAQGDLVTLTLDPTLEYGADTTALSSQGIVQKALKLVDRNKVVATAADKQYADYLKMAPTTARGSIVLEPGSRDYRGLTAAAPKVLEIIQFSGLFADSNSGTFSSEIRLAKLHNNETGEVTYIKGGSLSGSITENFKGLQLSRECVKRSYFSSDHAHGLGYSGPGHALLSEVSIVG